MTTTSSPNGGTFPGFDQLYGLNDPVGAAFRVELDAGVSSDEAYAFTTQATRPATPLLAKWYMGDHVPSDVIRTSSAGVVIVSNRLVALLRGIAATGWGTYEVRVVGANGDAIPGYQGLSVGGRCGPIDNSRSVEILRPPPARMKKFKGLYFDPASWDGSDVFMVEGKGYIFITERVKATLQQASISNVRFVRLDEYERPKAAMT